MPIDLMKIRRLRPALCIASMMVSAWRYVAGQVRVEDILTLHSLGERGGVQNVTLDNGHALGVRILKAACAAQIEREPRIALLQQHARCVARELPVRAQHHDV
jgi:hypothetical protein